MNAPALPSHAALALDAQWLPYKLDPVLRRVLWLRMDAARRAQAAFLDDRALTPDLEGVWAPLHAWPVLDASTRCDAIFHIGHCGSTLLSRVLGSWPGVQALREPMSLRTLADHWRTRDAIDARLAPEELDAVFDGLWSSFARAPDATRTVVKATSGCNSLIEPLLERRHDTRVVLLDMPLRPYLAALFKSPASQGDALAAAPERLLDLHRRGHGDALVLHALDPATQCAMGWLAERVRFDAIAQASSGRVLRVDFHALLADRARVLARIAGFLELAPTHLDAALAGDAWGRYAKADTHAYDAGDRAHDLTLSMQRNGEAITRATDWVEARVAADPGLQRVVSAAALHGD